jgi:acetolactate decarboxylase
MLLGCAHGQADFEGEAVYQVSSIDLLLAGGYDGHLSLAELKRHGDHGLGTF